jgi:hypothetical protein
MKFLILIQKKKKILPSAQQYAWDLYKSLRSICVSCVSLNVLRFKSLVSFSGSRSLSLSLSLSSKSNTSPLLGHDELSFAIQYFTPIFSRTSCPFKYSSWESVLRLSASEETAGNTYSIAQHMIRVNWSLGKANIILCSWGLVIIIDTKKS